MTKNLKLSYILFFTFSAILIAWNTLTSFFSGVAINYVGIVGILFVNLLLVLTDKELFKRIKDLFLISCVFCALEILVYFVFEFGCTDLNVLKGFLVYQNILTLFGLFFFAYVAFRFITEYKNIKIKFVEVMLGNEKRNVKQKKAKEISNGCLEEKPNQKCNENNLPEEENNNEEIEIIEEDEENVIIENEENIEE